MSKNTTTEKIKKKRKLPHYEVKGRKLDIFSYLIIAIIAAVVVGGLVYLFFVD